MESEGTVADKDLRRVAPQLERSCKIQAERVLVARAVLALSTAALIVAFVLDWPWGVRAVLIFVVLASGLRAFFDGLLLAAKRKELMRVRSELGESEGDGPRGGGAA